MRYRRLGSSNLKVSELCLGTMMFADQTDASEAASILAAASEQGVNFIDTADVYSKGDRKSTRLNSSHSQQSRMPSSA